MPASWFSYPDQSYTASFVCCVLPVPGGTAFTNGAISSASCSSSSGDSASADSSTFLALPKTLNRSASWA